MAFTFSYLYDKVLELTDKIGSDFFDVDYVMKRLETATFDFIGETVKFIENTQEIRDDLLSLYKPFNLSQIAHPPQSNAYLPTLPTDYLHLMNIQGVDASIRVRETNLIRHGQTEIQLNDPDTRPTPEYPIIVAYDTFIKLYSPGSPTAVTGFYVKKPEFGQYGIHDDFENEIAV